MYFRVFREAVLVNNFYIRIVGIINICPVYSYSSDLTFEWLFFITSQIKWLM